MKQCHFYGKLFTLARFVARTVFPRYTVHIPDDIEREGPFVYVSHHQNLFGPFVTLLWFPYSLHAWVLHVFLDQKTCYRHYVDYTFTRRFGWHKTWAKMWAWALSHVVSKLLNSGRSIPVFRGSRKIKHTLDLSVAALCRGESIIIFPDIDYRDNAADTKAMYDGFLYLEKYYDRETGRHLRFVPLFASKKKRLLIADRPVTFRDGVPFRTERRVVRDTIHAHLNKWAQSCGDV